MSKAHQMIVLREAGGHRRLAGFGRLLQVTFLFYLAAHGGIPVILDSIISPVQKYTTYKLHQNFNSLTKKLFLQEIFFMVSLTNCYFPFLVVLVFSILLPS